MNTYRTVTIPVDGNSGWKPRQHLINAIIEASARGEALVVPIGPGDASLRTTVATLLNAKGYRLHSRRMKQDGAFTMWCTPLPMVGNRLSPVSNSLSLDDRQDDPISLP